MIKPEICYLDMDGVIADFANAAMSVHSDRNPCRYTSEDIKEWDFHYNILGFTPETERIFWEPMGFSFWYNLEKEKWADDLVDLLLSYFDEDHILIVTSPCDTHGCMDGKREWIKKHYPQFSRSVVFSKQKWKLCHPGSLLIDDSESNIEKASKVRNILFPRTWNSKREYANDPVYDVKLELEWHLRGSLFSDGEVE